MGAVEMGESVGSDTSEHKQGSKDFSNLTNKIIAAHDKAHLAYDAAQKQFNAAEEIFDGSLHKLYEYNNPSNGGKYSDLVEQALSSSQKSLISSHEALDAVNEYLENKDLAHEFLTKDGVGDSLNHFHDANFVNFNENSFTPKEDSDGRIISKMWESIWLNVGK